MTSSWRYYFMVIFPSHLINGHHRSSDEKQWTVVAPSITDQKSDQKKSSFTSLIKKNMQKLIEVRESELEIFRGNRLGGTNAKQPTYSTVSIPHFMFYFNAAEESICVSELILNCFSSRSDFPNFNRLHCRIDSVHNSYRWLAKTSLPPIKILQYLQPAMAYHILLYFILLFLNVKLEKFNPLSSGVSSMLKTVIELWFRADPLSGILSVFIYPQLAALVIDVKGALKDFLTAAILFTKVKMKRWAKKRFGYFGHTWRSSSKTLLDESAFDVWTFRFCWTCKMWPILTSWFTLSNHPSKNFQRVLTKEFSLLLTSKFQNNNVQIFND